jgi:hypothetical protein
MVDAMSGRSSVQSARLMHAIEVLPRYQTRVDVPRGRERSEFEMQMSSIAATAVAHGANHLASDHGLARQHPAEVQMGIPRVQATTVVNDHVVAPAGAAFPGCGVGSEESALRTSRADMHDLASRGSHNLHHGNALVGMDVVIALVARRSAFDPNGCADRGPPGGPKPGPRAGSWRHRRAHDLRLRVAVFNRRPNRWALRQRGLSAFDLIVDVVRSWLACRETGSADHRQCPKYNACKTSSRKVHATTSMQRTSRIAITGAKVGIYRS